MLYFDTNYTPTECSITPAIVLFSNSCDDPDCTRSHKGGGIAIHWFWWGVVAGWDDINHPHS